MVTYVWQPGETKNNKYVYLCGGVSDTPNSSLAEQSRQLAANIVNNESEYATKFGNISSYLDENVVENGYRYYWQPNSECFYGICDVQATIYQTPDRTPNVITALEHTNNGSVLFIDFYNLVGKDGTDGTSATGKTNLDYRYASSASTYPTNMIFTEASGTSPFGAWYLGVTNYDPKTAILPFSTSEYTWTKIKGEDGHDGGVKANWGDLTKEQQDQLKEDLRGDDGQPGAAGAPGVAAFKSIVFTRNNANSVDTPTGGDYNNPWPEQTAWSDGIPSGDAKLWMSTRIFTSDGSAPQQDSWTEPEIIADTAYMDYEFSSASTRPIAPEKETPSSTMMGDTWHNEATDEDIWMAYRQVENGEYKTGSNWAITKIKGEDGEDGEGFTLGEPWSTVATFENTEGADENEYHVYTGHEEGYEEHTGWLFKWIEDDDFGPEDIPFTGGTGYWHPVSQFEGTPGQSYFTHIKYANKVLKPSEDPECIESAWTVTTINVDSRDIVIKLTGDPDDPTAPRGEDSGNYIGLLANGEEQDPHAASAYTWSSWKGRDGYGVEYIYTHTSAYTAPVVPICDTASTDYQTSGYVPTTEIETSGVTWEDDPMDTTAENPYVWLVSRKNIDSTWHAFVGSKYEPTKAVLFAKYGLDGETPEARFTSVVFKVSAEVPTTPNNLSGTTEVAGKLVKYNTYDNPMPNPEEGWTDTISGMSPYACIWMATRIFTTDVAKQLQDGYRWSNPVRANDTDSIDNEWLTGHTTLSVSDIINNNLYPLRTSPDDVNPGTGQLNPDGHGWYDDPVDNATFMASVKIVNGEYERVNGKINWKITKIKGEKGDAGKSYTLKEQETGEWLDTTEKNPEAYDISMYDAHVCSSGYTATTEGGEKIYTEGNLYVWDGDSWEDAGKFAPDSSYIHVKYANEDENGTEIHELGKKLKFTGDESTLGEVPGAYLGILNDAVEEDSRIITDYTWSLTKGKDGFGYEYIYCLSDAVPGEYSGLSLPSPHHSGDTRFTQGDVYSGGEITNASEYQNDDYIPTVKNTNIVWRDDPFEPTVEKPFCYMVYRKKNEEGKWGEYRGTGLEGKFATLFTRYTKDGEDGVDGPGAEYIYILKTDEHAFDNFGELTSGPKYKYAGSTAWTEIGWSYSGAMYDHYNFIPGTWRDSGTTIESVDEWSDDPLELTATLPIEFVSVRYKEIDTATGNMVWTPFSQPRVWARYSKDGIDGSVLSSVTEYYIATSAMTPTPTSGSTGADWSGWTINATPENFNATNKYLWNSEVCKYMDGMITTTVPAMIGTYSKDIDYILEYYAVSNSQIIPPTGWEEEIPEEYSWTTVPSAATTTEGNPYLWNFERIYYTDGTYETHEPAVIGTKGRDAVLYALELSNDIDVFGTGPDKRLDNPVTATTTLIAYHNGKKENIAIKTVSAEISPAAGWEVSYNGIGTSEVDVTIEIPTGTTFTSETPYHVTLTATVQATGYSEYEGTVVFKVIGNKEGADGVSYKLLSNYDQIVWSGNTSTPAIENWKFSAVTMSNGVQMPLDCDFKFDVDGEAAIVDLTSSCSFPNDELDAPRSSMTVTIYANGDSSFIYDKESFPVLYQGKDGEPGVNYEIISNYDSRVITVDSEGQVIGGIPDDGETWVFTAYKVVGETSVPVEVFWAAKIDDNAPEPLGFQWSSCTFDDIFGGGAELPLSSMTIEIFADSSYQEVLKSKSFPVIQNGQKGDPGEPDTGLTYLKKVFQEGVTQYSGAVLSDFVGVLDGEHPDNFPIAMLNGSTNFVENKPFVESGITNRVMIAAGVSGTPQEIEHTSMDFSAYVYNNEDYIEHHGSDYPRDEMICHPSRDWRSFIGQIRDYYINHSNRSPIDFFEDGKVWLPFTMTAYEGIMDLSVVTEHEYIWGANYEDIEENTLKIYIAYANSATGYRTDSWTTIRPVILSGSQLVVNNLVTTKSASTVSASTIIYEDGKLFTKDIDARKGRIGSFELTDKKLSFIPNYITPDKPAKTQFEIHTLNNEDYSGVSMYAKNVKIESGTFGGTMRPGMAFRYLNHYSFDEDEPSSMNGKYDVIQAWGGDCNNSEIGWSADSIGRRIVIICADGINAIGGFTGAFRMTAPTNCYFWEDGILRNELRVENEIVELLGYGTPGTGPESGGFMIKYSDSGSTFLGYIVLNRQNISTNKRYGHGSRVLCHCYVYEPTTAGTSACVISQYSSFDASSASVVTSSHSGASVYTANTGLTIYRGAQGTYEITLPYKWFRGDTSNIGINLVTYLGTQGSENDSFGCIVDKGAYGFKVATLIPLANHPNTRYNVPFEFTLYNYGDWTTLTPEITIQTEVSSTISDKNVYFNCTDTSQTVKRINLAVNNILTGQTSLYTCSASLSNTAFTLTSLNSASGNTSDDDIYCSKYFYYEIKPKGVNPYTTTKNATITFNIAFNGSTMTGLKQTCNVVQYGQPYYPSGS